MQKTEQIYVLGDGDKIRERIEYHLLNSELELLTKVSQGIAEALNYIKSLAISTMNAEIIMAAGDDILFRLNSEDYQKEQLVNLSNNFQKLSSCSISFGVGKSVIEAYINLRRAKSSTTTKIMENEID